jgi:hypothetical protein
VTSYGTPTAESLGHLPPAGEGLGPWLRGHGWPAGTPRVAAGALAVAVVGAGAALAGATLPWIAARLVDRRIGLLRVSYRGISPDLPGYTVIALAAAVVGLVALARSRPSRPWLTLPVAGGGLAIVGLTLTSLDQAGAIRRRLLSVPLFLEDTTGVAAHTTPAFGWWLTLAGGAGVTVAALTAFVTLTRARRRASPPG